MPDFRRSRCLPKRGGCGRHESEVGPISWGGLCGECGPAKFIEANEGMHYHRGPWFDHWRRSMAASVGGVLLEDLNPPA